MTKNNLYTIIPYKNNLIKLSCPIRARAIYKNKIINLLNCEEVNSDWKNWFEEYSFSIGKTFSKPRVTHLFYELGFLLEAQNIIEDFTILAIDIEFQHFSFLDVQASSQKVNVTLEKTISFEEFQILFDQGKTQLLAGNCYQFNLTCEHVYKWSEDYQPLDFVMGLWKSNSTRGAFGSATYIPMFDRLYLSNSPECLFQIKKNVLSTMPIKGTLPFFDHSDFDSVWGELKDNKKNQSELYMIIDLMKNDLAKIELPKVNVVKKKVPLLVPGLLHQYAKIEIELSEKITVKKILENIFPGGSVTGAPKKRAIKLLFDLEKRERKFYCGSTMICFQHMKSASINIRSAEVDLQNKILTYQSGGGITLQSESLEEFREMVSKRESFIRAL